VDRVTQSTGRNSRSWKRTNKAPDLQFFRAAYRNRTDDLRITRSTVYRSGHATCTDHSTRAPECSGCAVRSGFPVHDPVHGPASPSGDKVLRAWPRHVSTSSRSAEPSDLCRVRAVPTGLRQGLDVLALHRALVDTDSKPPESASRAARPASGSPSRRVFGWRVPPLISMSTTGITLRPPAHRLPTGQDVPLPRQMTPITTQTKSAVAGL